MHCSTRVVCGFSVGRHAKPVLGMPACTSALRVLGLGDCPVRYACARGGPRHCCGRVNNGLKNQLKSRLVNGLLNGLVLRIPRPCACF